MSIKDLFEKQKENSISLKAFTKSTIEQFSGDVESADYVEQRQIYNQTLIPDLDYSTASNFIKFGSAAKYYQNSIDRITNYYPYDGSKAEQLDFYNSLNPLEKYIIDNEYPRTTGYVNFSPSGWGSAASKVSGVGLPNTVEYISFYNQQLNNVYSIENNQLENTRFIFSSGSTVEFWMKKNAFADNTTQTAAESIFYLKTTDSDKIFNIYLSTDASYTSSILASYYVSGVSKFTFTYDTNLSTIADSNWHHYAFTFYSSSAGYTSDFYLDGVYKQTKSNTVVGSFVNLTGSAFGVLGAVGGNFGATATPIGSAKLTGSIDEFRFWNTKRDAKQIGINYFTHIGGGTNTDLANVNLGVYYKFNEGITGNNSTDSIILDYAGRVCNGTFTGYNTLSRSTGSAINDATDSIEPTDPIIYSNHPDVVAYSTAKATSGSFYDANNVSSLMNSMPKWILEEDTESGDTLTNFLQVLASYLDTLYLQISNINKLKNISYEQHGGKQNPFNHKLLTSLGFDTPDLFINSDILKSLFDQDDKRLFEEKLADIKNQIYQNIYNNLIYINKSKGTEKAFRNLVRCFGGDDELFKLTIYANNNEYKYLDSYNNVGVKKAYLDMTNVVNSQNSQAVIYQYPESGNVNSIGFISQSSNYNVGITLETEMVFPKQEPTYNNPLLSNPTTYVSQSLFGIHQASTNQSDTTFQNPDKANLQVYSVTVDNNTKFVITSSLGLYGETSTFRNVFNDSRWNISFRFSPVGYPFVNGAFATSSYKAEFYGYNYDSGELLNSFTASFTVTTSSAANFYSVPKRVYVGAHRTNITGALLASTNIKPLAVRYWNDYLQEDELQVHARDVANFGRDNPYRNTFVFEGGQINSVYIPKIETLSLNWDFETVSTSDGSGIVSTIPDIKSASISYVKYPSQFNNLVGYQSTGKGSYFANSFQVRKNEYYNSSRIQVPENVNSDELIQILEHDDDKVTSETLPQSLFFSVESSMYDTISRKALEFFSTIIDFNNLVGQPSNKYKMSYTDLTKLRQLFFEKVENSPDLDKYVGLYKWMDDALEGVLNNLIPASANANDKIRTIVESHILERNKYKYTIVASGSLPSEQYQKVIKLTSGGTDNHGVINFGGNEQQETFAGDNNSTITNFAPIIKTSVIPPYADHSKIRTTKERREYIESEYVRRSYVVAPSSQRQSVGFDPRVKTKYDRSDTNLINSTVDSTTQNNTRKNALNVVNLEYTKNINVSEISMVKSPDSSGNLSNSQLLYFKTYLNTNNPATKIILTPDTKQVFLPEDIIKQQIDLFEEDRS